MTNISIGLITTDNPTLFVNMDSLVAQPPAQVQYIIQTLSPGPAYCYVNQFCSLLTTYWLNDPNSPQAYGIGNLNSSAQISAAQQLINLSSLEAQATEAKNAIGNSSLTTLKTPVQSADVDAALKGIPVGSKIWAGSDMHVVGFLINPATTSAQDAPLTYTFYDSDNGIAQAGWPLTNLASFIAAMGYSSLVIGLPA
jgi:hypothetical protein